MLWKVLFLLGVTLFVAKHVFRTRWRQWGEKLDRLVNITILAIALSYGLYFIWLLLGSPDLVR